MCLPLPLPFKSYTTLVPTFNFNFNFNFNFVYWLTIQSITTTTTDSIYTSNGTPFCRYSALPIHHGKFPPKSHKGHPISGLYVEVRGANYEFIHELKTAMYRESVAPVKQWNRFTVKSVHTHKKTWVKCISEMYKQAVLIHCSGLFSLRRPTRD